MGSNKVVDLTGSRFGKLRVISRAVNKGRHSAWNCICDCGNLKTVRRDGLVRENGTKSCGCIRVAACVKAVKKHSMSKSTEYRIWAGVVQRCNNPKNKRYHDYGGRGITVCERWNKFENFYEDMGDRPEGLSIDRIDNSKGYYKENCKWSTLVEQQANRGTNKNNTSGRKGVFLTPHGKWGAAIMFNRVMYRLGQYDKFEDACNARELAEIKFHGKSLP